MLGLITSNGLVLAMVAGVPAAVALLVLIGMRTRGRAVLWLAVALVIVAVTAAGAYAIFTSEPAHPTLRPAAGGTPPPSGPPPTTPAPPPPSPPTCTPAGTTLQLTAKNVTFSTNCLAAPAGQAFKIEFHNDDASIPHNVDIFTADPATDQSAQSLFAGSLLTGPGTTTYDVNALQAGTYFFHCDVHPQQMFGTFVVS